MNLLEGSGTSSVTNNVFTDMPGDTDAQFGVSSITSGSPTISGNTFQNMRTALHLATGNATVSGNTFTGTRFGNANVGVGIEALEGSATIVANDIHLRRARLELRVQARQEGLRVLLVAVPQEGQAP